MEKVQNVIIRESMSLLQWIVFGIALIIVVICLIGGIYMIIEVGSFFWEIKEMTSLEFEEFINCEGSWRDCLR